MSTSQSLARLAVCLLAAVALPYPSVQAQGFGLNEVGTCAVSRGFAATGTPCGDASTIFWNPAAAAELPGKSISIGASAIIVKGWFRQDSTGRTYPSDISPSLPPAGFAAMRFGKGSVGLGVYVPYGLTSQWNDDFPGRFSALRASLQTIYFQPNVAYQLTDNWSIGGGPVFGHSTVDVTQAIDLSQQQAAPGITFGQLGVAYETEFARTQVHGSANAVGYNVGVHGRYGRWSVGARYLSVLTFNYDHASAKFSQTATGLVLPQGNPVSPTGSPVPLDVLLGAQFTTGGALVHQSASSTIKHPWQLQGGIGYTGFARTTLSVDVARLGWSAFNTLPITFNGPAASSSRTLFEGYNDSWSYRFGAEHMIGSWTGRLGYSYAETPVPDETVTPLLPDMNRRNFSAGVAIPVTSVYRVDIGYLHVNTPGRRGRIADSPASPPGPTLPLAVVANTGTYTLKADVISAALNITF
jgi:long-chain fatty acid transport protein